MLLTGGGERLLHVDRQNAPFVQAFGDHTHAGMMDVGIRGTWLGRLETGLLGVQHGLIQPLLKVGEPTIGRERTGDVGGIQAVDFHAGIDQQQLAGCDGTGVTHPMQNRSMRAGCDDGVVTDLVAFLAGDCVERTFQHTFRTRFAQSRRQPAQDVVEAVLGEFVQSVVGGGIAVRIGETVRLANILYHLGDLRIGLTNHTDAYCTGLGSDILAQCIGQLRDVVRLDARHGGHLPQTRARTHPIFAIVGIHEEVLRVMVRARSHEQFRLMRPAGLCIRGIRIDRVQHQHRAGLIVLAKTGVIREGGVRTERVVAIVVAYLRLTGRDYEAFARERPAQRLKTCRRVLGGFQRFDGRLIVIPTGGHELLERVGTRA